MAPGRVPPLSALPAGRRPVAPALIRAPGRTRSDRNAKLGLTGACRYRAGIAGNSDEEAPATLAQQSIIGGWANKARHEPAVWPKSAVDNDPVAWMQITAPALRFETEPADGEAAAIRRAGIAFDGQMLQPSREGLPRERGHACGC